MLHRRHPVNRLRRALHASSTLYKALPSLNLVPRPAWCSRVEGSIGPHGIPTFRCLDSNSRLLDESDGLGAEDIPHDRLLKMYTTMLLLPTYDTVLYNSQRQGRLSFYMTSYGEEAAVVCSAAAWGETDEVFAQYREQGILLYRGMPIEDMMAQCFGSARDQSTKGRQMPVHYGSRKFHYHTISSPLATQIPQAAGAAFGLKRMAQRGEGRTTDAVICYMGEGACSEGDFHAGVNIASLLGGPLILFVRNNSFAISTPATQQFAGDGIASRAPGYGIPALRVDGNDPIAVHIASLEARRKAIESCRPVMIEAMTYRVGHHSTSDDSSAYRSRAEVDQIKRQDNPLYRMRQYLQNLGLWSTELEEETKAAHKRDVLTAFSHAEAEPKPALSSMFEDVFVSSEERPIREQRAEMNRLVAKYGGYVPSWQSFLGKLQRQASIVGSS